MHDLAYIASFLQARDGYTIISHVSPDGDTLGSSLALYCALLKLGKRVQVVCENSVPAVYRFLPHTQDVLKPDAAEKLPHVICVDCAAKDRLGAALPIFNAAAHSINIDHHMTNTAYANDNCIRDTAATGEIIFDLLSMLNLLDVQSATCLYTAIVTDTGNFAYGNTTADTLRKAAELMEEGADNVLINRCVYRSVPLRKLCLLRTALASLQLYEDDRIRMICITQKDLEEAGASSEDVEGIIDHVRDIESVEIAVMVRESSLKNTAKISLRSKKYADVSSIAKAMDGGGHKHAAGYTDHGALDEVYERVRSAVQQLLKEA